MQVTKVLQILNKQNKFSFDALKLVCNFNISRTYETNTPSCIERKLHSPVSVSGYPSPIKEAWLESLKEEKDTKLGLIDLNPDVFGVFPRIDIIHENLAWQGQYRFVDWRRVMTRWEIKRTGKKLYQQKGLGRARHGDRTAPQFYGGAQVVGPILPKARFSLIPKSKKLKGLTSALTVKFIQDDLHIVDDFDIPSDDPEYLENLIQSRKWGNSVLFVYEHDEAPKRIAQICQSIPHYLLIPVYSLNVWSIVKYDTVVMTLPALEMVEDKIIGNMLNPKLGDSVAISDAFKNPGSRYESWTVKRGTNTRGKPETHEDYLEFES